MLIEQTTTYAYKLKYLENLSFEKVKTLAKKFIDELPKELFDDLFNVINRDDYILKTEPEMFVYLYSFGEMHQAKLNFTFDKIPEEFFSQPEINIIDYGCGQAIGTMCYADFLKSKNYNQRIKSVTLIEPSEICIKRAALHTSVFLPDAKIVTVNKTFDELAKEDINREEDVPTLHILSNVLDLEFDLERFAEFLKGRLQGYNQFVCVGSYFSISDKDRRVEKFVELVGGDISFSKAFRKGEFEIEKTWTCQAVLALVGNSEDYLSTVVTNADLIENCINDGYGVLYSKDGKKLLKGNTKFETYIVKDGTRVICNSAFYEQFSFDENILKRVILPNSITSIGESAFCHCFSLQQITIPKSVKSIGGGAFNHCFNLKINLCSNSFIERDKMLIDNKRNILLSYFGKDEELVIPNFVTRIESYAFVDCDSLQKITIPNSVKHIGYGAFSGCESLQQITIPNSVSSVNQFTFCDCHSLQIITIPNSVLSIGRGAFIDCKSLQQVTIPNSVRSIDGIAFLGCELLQQVTIPNSVRSIGDDAFDGCVSLQQIIIPEGSEDHFKQILPEELWDNLYYLKKSINQPNDE